MVENGGKALNKYLTLPRLLYIIIYQWKENKPMRTTLKQSIICNQEWLNQTKLSVIA